MTINVKDHATVGAAGDVKIKKQIINNINTRNKILKRLTTQLPTIAPDKIIGRHKELTDLHKRLFDNKQVVLVNGLGGI